MTDPLPSSLSDGNESIILTVDADSRVSWAMECNGLPLVRRVIVRDGTREALAGARLEISLGDLAHPLTISVPPLEPASEWMCETPNLVLNGARLRSLLERERAMLSLVLLTGSVERARVDQSVEVLASNEWDRSRLPELLAAFVTPNHPFISSLLQVARAELQQMTGDPGFHGYSRRSRERVLLTTQAIFSGLGKIDLAYVPAPASFESTGQKIRLADDLQQYRLGNCLDISLVLAAALEQAGLHPVLLLFKEHVVPGVWLVNEWLPVTVSDDRLIPEKLLRCGDLVLFEATAALNRPVPSFEAAVQQAEGRLLSGEAFEMFLDIRAARLARLLPLPLRRENGLTTEVSLPEGGSPPMVRVGASIEGDPAETHLQEGAEPSRTAVSAADSDSASLRPIVPMPVIPRLEAWKERLLDLSLRNRLLHYRPSREKTIPLAVRELPELENRLADGRQLILEPLPAMSGHDPRQKELVEDRGGEEQLETECRRLLENDRLLTELNEAELQKRCRAIFRQARTELEESGTSTLYLAFGFLRWFESESSPVPRLAPILLYPVEITRPVLRGRYVVRVRDDDPRLNDTLLEKLRREFQLDFSPLKTLPLDDSGIDLATVLSLLRQVTARISRFDVVDQAVLGFFSFAKFLMWRDLNAHLEDLVKNDLVRHMVEGNGNQAFTRQPFLEERVLDDTYPPEKPPIVLDADGSQLVAIDAALRGNTFVLQGPPGTGKSQTIANIIAASIAEGRRVLFVAEKRAALEVVARRLRMSGLGDACLELHSNRANKRDVALELFRVYQLGLETRKPALEVIAKELADDRQALNRFVELMNGETPLGWTNHECIGRLLTSSRESSGKKDGTSHRSGETPAGGMFGFPDPLAMDATTWRNRHQLVNELADAATPFFPPARHPLRPCRITDWTPALEREREAELRSFLEAGETLQRAWGGTQEALGCSFPARLEHLQVMISMLRLLENPRREGVAELLARTDAGKILSRLDQLLVWSVEREALWQKLEPLFRTEFLDLDLLSLRRDLTQYQDSFVVWRWWKLRECWAILGRVARSPLGDAVTVAPLIEIGLRVQELGRLIRTEEALLVELLGPSLHERLPDQKEIARLVCTVREWREYAQKLPLDVMKFAATGSGTAEAWLLVPVGQSPQMALRAIPAEQATTLVADLVKAFQKFGECWARVVVGWKVRVKEAFGREGDSLTMDELLHAVGQWLANRGLLRDWSRWNRAVEAMEDVGLGSVTGRLAEGTIPGPSWAAALEVWLAHDRFEALCGQERVVAEFSGRRHDRMAERFRSGDRELIELQRLELRSRLAARRPSFGTAVSEYSEVGILQKEARRKRGHLPVRRLLERIPHLLGKLKPCLLMSPLSIAQFLPPEGERFDLVIFDEASQIAVHDAVGAVARGRQVIVVGDSKQLPPTTFFQADPDSGADNPADIDAEQLLARDLESILEEAAAALVPTVMLRWHYRSRDERLIAFSNRHYYENRLQTFPAACLEGDGGVQLVPVPGVFQRGGDRTNPAEAQAVVERITSHLRDESRRHLSLGVVTFNQPQQMLIEDLLEDARSRFPEIESFFSERAPEPVFVKNLENVQGDERDVMLFSITYAPDEAGNVSMNFGPLNRSGGERRLNVAITRARRQLLVFSGLSPEMIDLNRTNALGVRHLREFLLYAAGRESGFSQASDGMGSQDAGGGIQNHLAQEIASFLRGRGWKVDERIGCAQYRLDLAVRDPLQGRMLLGIETDGNAYGSPGPARDRERLRFDVLHHLGWRLHRCYLLDWLNHPEFEQERLVGLLEKLRNEPVGPLEPGANESLKPEAAQNGADENGLGEAPASGIGQDVPLPRGISGITEEAGSVTNGALMAASGGWAPFQPLNPEKLGDSESFSRRDQTDRQKQVLQQLIVQEGPVHLERVSRFLVQAYGMTRIGTRAAQRVKDLVQELSRAGSCREAGDFLWPATLDPVRDFPAPRGAPTDGEPRPPEYIAPEEMAAAARVLLNQAVSLPRGELARVVALSLGFRRVTPRTLPFFQAGIQVLVDRGLAVADGERIRQTEKAPGSSENGTI